MRLRCVAALLVALLAAAGAQRPQPFVPVGVWYDGSHLPPSAVLRDLHTIRALGFNHVRTAVRWADVEPARGTYRLDPLDQLLTLADQAGLAVIVDWQIDPRPAWLAEQSGNLALMSAFIEAVSSRAARHRSFMPIDPRRSPYGISISPRPLEGTPWSPVQLAWRLDAIRSAAGERGWRVDALQAGPATGGRSSAGVTGADLRLWTWTAIARGARAISFASWYGSPGGVDNAGGLMGRDGEADERVRVAGELAGLISRNAALFAPLRPRPSAVAIVYNPVWDAAPFAAAALAQASTVAFYERLFERNIQADIVHPDSLVAGGASNFALVFAAAPEMLPRAIRDALDAYVRAGGKMIVESQADAADLARIRTDVRIDGGGGLVEARFLESADALVLVALNHADAPRAVTFTFTGETPEAIWQNMETGASVSFVQGRDGLTHRHTFAPRDALVLMIRKTLR